MTTNTNIKTDVTTDTSDTELMEGIYDTGNASNMGVNTNGNTDDNMNVMLMSTAKEHTTEIDYDDEEGMDHVIFTFDEEDNIFDDMVKEDTLH